MRDLAFNGRTFEEVGKLCGSATVEVIERGIEGETVNDSDANESRGILAVPRK